MYKASNGQYRHLGVGVSPDAALREWHDRNIAPGFEFAEISRMAVDGVERRTYLLKREEFSETVIVWIHKVTK